jgi:hypothetical protein
MIHSLKPGMSNSVSTKGSLERGDCSERHHMDAENYNLLLLLIPRLNLNYIYRSTTFPRVHTDVNCIETRLHFI